MKKLTITLLLAVTLPLSGALSGCAATSAGVKKGDERNFARSLNDVSAARAIKARMKRAEGHNLKGVDVEVAEGTALLSGNVRTPEARIEAERIAWSGAHVTQVGNELLVSGRQGLGGDTKDRFINSKLKARLTADKTVKARNYNIEVNKGIVYLLGVARTTQELERAAYLASTTKGVNEVISYVKLAEDARPNYSVPNAPMPNSQYVAPEAYPAYQAPQAGLATAELPAAGEPRYYQDPQTGEYYLIQSSVTTPAVGGPSAPARVSDMGDNLGKNFPSDHDLGAYRTGVQGEAVSVIESEPYYLDPDTGEHIPLSAVQGLQ